MSLLKPYIANEPPPPPYPYLLDKVRENGVFVCPTPPQPHPRREHP